MTRELRSQLVFWLCLVVVGLVIWFVSGRLAN